MTITLTFLGMCSIVCPVRRADFMHDQDLASQIMVPCIVAAKLNWSHTDKFCI